MRNVHTVVLGAGPGGYVAAIRLAQLGVETLLVEREYMGGVCLNVGCIPSKALIHAAKTYESVSKMDQLGITADLKGIDFEKTQNWKNKTIDQLTKGIEMLVVKNGADILKGSGHFTSENTMDVTTLEGNVEQITFTNCIIATGSLPIEIPAFPTGGRILDSTTALSLTEVPGKMAIIGGGYIGLELGFVYRKLGAEVTVIEMMDTVLPGFDKDIIKLMQRKLKKDKFVVHTNARAEAYRETETGIELDVTAKNKTITIEADVLFVSVGRKPNSRGFGLENTGVAVNEQGFIAIDEHMKTNVPGIYAIGDVTGQPMLAHHASYQGEIAAEVIAGHAAMDQSKVCPAVVFTDPEIAAVGMMEAEAREKGLDVVVGQFPFAALGKAKTQNTTEGFVKLVAEKTTEEVLGVAIVGPHASDLIGEATLGIEMGAFLDDFSLTIHPHPTLTESLMEAAKKAKGAAIHVLN
ncbi:MAG: dihydrolipoyl dehydrogenase [Acidobacteria bacterium]|nr:MAG: dihydrolipoyl dehydrogenase [Acidobacteriota bacterium]